MFPNLFLLVSNVLPQQALDCGTPEEKRAYVECMQTFVGTFIDEWYQIGLSVAEKFFIALAILEIVATGWSIIRKQGDIGNIVQLATIKILALGLIWLLVNTSQVWLGAPVYKLPETLATDMATHVVVNEEATLPPATPAGLINYGASVIPRVFQTWFESGNWGNTIFRTVAVGWVTGGWGVFIALIPVLMLLAASIYFLFIFVKFAVELFKTIMECYLVGGGGIVLAGLLAFRGTSPIAEGLFIYVIEVTIRMFFLIIAATLAMKLGDSVMATLGQDLFFRFDGNQWTGALSNALDLNAIGGAVALFFVTMLTQSLMQVPQQMAQVLTQRLSINVKAFLQNL